MLCRARDRLDDQPPQVRGLVGARSRHHHLRHLPPVRGRAGPRVALGATPGDSPSACPSRTRTRSAPTIGPSARVIASTRSPTPAPQIARIDHVHAAGVRDAVVDHDDLAVQARKVDAAGCATVLTSSADSSRIPSAAQPRASRTEELPCCRARRAALCPRRRVTARANSGDFVGRGAAGIPDVELHLDRRVAASTSAMISGCGIRSGAVVSWNFQSTCHQRHAGRRQASRASPSQRCWQRLRLCALVAGESLRLRPAAGRSPLA